tara:strand:- start:207 stop:497 length:291 start_codon:yes stop_codon:yes gene_type:complete
MPTSYRLEVHATPSARSNKVGGQHDGALRVSVTAVADKGKANTAIAKLLAKTLGISRSSIEMVSGQTNRRKVFQIMLSSDLTQDQIKKKVRELMTT